MSGRILFVTYFALLVFGIGVTASCTGQSAVDQKDSGDGEGKLQVLSTTNLVADTVRQVAGDRVDQTILIPTGVDEHGFQPSPQDIAKASDADIIFINGAGLEVFTEKLLQNAGENLQLVAVSDGVQLIKNKEILEEEADHLEGDPHTWTDPNNVMIWVDNIEKALTEADPANAGYYRENASRYRQELKELDGWVVEQVSQIPQERRKLVTDHTVFTYFANRYGFEQVGAVIPGYSSLAQPSAQEMAQLEDTIRSLQVPAVFVGSTVNPSLLERVAQDTGTKLVPIFTGSLTDEEGSAPTYTDYIRYNVTAIVDALK